MILTFGIVAYNACRYLPSLLSDLKKQGLSAFFNTSNISR